MGKRFDTEELLDAFDEIADAAIAAGERLEICVYGGSALMLASNFRFASEDVDVSAIERPWPAWLDAVVAGIARRNGWLDDWFNDGVAFHLSPLASRANDHVEFGTFPRAGGEKVGMIVHVPTADYMLAVKLKARRVGDPDKRKPEQADILNLAQVCGVRTIDDAVAILAKFFPRSGSDAGKQRFVLNAIWNEPRHGDPRYPERRGDREPTG
jgi:hypothetical protein